MSIQVPVESIEVFGRGQANIDALCRYADQLGVSSQVCGSGREAIEGADLVVTSVTFSADLVPFVESAG